MAIDSASKRFSIMNMRSPILRPSFIPDGAVNNGDRYHLLNLYFGIVLGLPIAAIDYYFSLLSTIDDSDLGLISLVSTAGQGVLSSVTGTTGYSSPMDSDVQTAYCAIFGSGKSLESTI